jgi:hypothetical protein
MLRKLKIPALLVGALMMAFGPATAMAADRGGHGGGGHGGSGQRGGGQSRSFSRGGEGGRSYNSRGNEGRRDFRGGERGERGERFERGYGGYYGGGYGYYGYPYTYAPAYPYSTCGYYDQWGRWIADPYCYGY